MMGGVNQGADLVAALLPVGSVGVEIGVWRGDSTALFLKRASHVHLVDPWSVEPYRGAGFDDYLNAYRHIVGAARATAYQAYYDRIHAEVERRFPRHQATIHRCTSNLFFALFRGPVDWFYIDGLHDYASVSSDLVCASRVLAPDGVLYGDDYENKPGVKRAVDEFARPPWTLTLLGKNQYALTR